MGWDVLYSLKSGDSAVWVDLGITPASVGDSVRQIDDISGNSRNATAPGAAQRGVLQSSGSVRTDASDDRYTFTNTGSALGFTVAMTIQPITDNINSMPLRNSGGSTYIAVKNTPSRVILAGPGLSTPSINLSSGFTSKMTIVITVSASGVAKLYENGSYVATFTGTATTGWTWNMIGHSFTTFNGDIFNLGIKANGVLSDAQILDYAKWSGTA